MTRAIWKGCLQIGSLDLPVKLYSAVEDRSVHFRLLHKTDREPVHQEIVRKSDGRPVEKSERRKALPVENDRAVIIQPDELRRIGPDRSRAISLCRFVPARAMSDIWHDRPYYLGPDGDTDDYFALAATLARKNRIGIVRWTMRARRYVGALHEDGGYLAVVTLRRADQILAVDHLERPKAAVDTEELELAKQLIALVAGDFEPTLWQDEYRERVHALIAARQRGDKPRKPAARRRKSSGALAAQLSRSLANMKEKKVA
jgi:DNA end-binding protein Ku